MCVGGGGGGGGGTACVCVCVLYDSVCVYQHMCACHGLGFWDLPEGISWCTSIGTSEWVHGQYLIIITIGIGFLHNHRIVVFC